MLRKLISLLLGATACTHTVYGTTAQPPIVNSADRIPESEHIVLSTKDMDLPVWFTLKHSAKFIVVSKDRLRFHVRLTSKWKEIANPEYWNATLTIDRNSYHPEHKEKRFVTKITKIVDYAKYYPRRNAFGDPTNMQKERPLITSESPEVLDIYVGSGDYVFYSKDIFRKNIKLITLTLEHGGLTYVFSWRLK